MDILFCSAPGTFSSRPTLAPAILKACATNAGFTATAVDLNIEIYNLLRNHPRQKLLEDFFYKLSQKNDYLDVPDSIKRVKSEEDLMKKF